MSLIHIEDTWGEPNGFQTFWKEKYCSLTSNIPACALKLHWTIFKTLIPTELVFPMNKENE